MLEKIKQMYPEKCVVLTPGGKKDILIHSNHYPTFSKHFSGYIYLAGVLVYNADKKEYAEILEIL